MKTKTIEVILDFNEESLSMYERHLIRELQNIIEEAIHSVIMKEDIVDSYNVEIPEEYR